MTVGLLPALLWFTALGSGLLAGVFLACSAFIMRALVTLPPVHGAAAMNAINSTILRSPFMPIFFGVSLAAPGVAALGFTGATLTETTLIGTAFDHRTSQDTGLALVTGASTVLGASIVTAAHTRMPSGIQPA